jgi:hypothetical protein
MDCPYCDRSLRPLSIRCRVCDRFVPRWPHLTFLVLLALAILVGIIILLELLAKSHS